MLLLGEEALLLEDEVSPIELEAVLVLVVKEFVVRLELVVEVRLEVVCAF